MRRGGDSEQVTVNSEQVTVKKPLPPFHCSLLPPAISLLPVACCLLPFHCCLLPAPCCLLPAPRSLFPVPCSLAPRLRPSKEGETVHSIRTKIAALTIAIIIINVVITGVISILSIHDAADTFSTQFMNELCADKAGDINTFLDEIQQDVDIAANYLTDAVDIVSLVQGGVIGAMGTGDSIVTRDWDSEQQALFDQYLARHVAEARVIFHSIAYNTNSALTYYYRINPEFTLSVPGFFYVRQGDSDFQEQTPTDILAYPSDDISHVGWYYSAMDRGRPSWLLPYEDANVGGTVVSYSAPIYKAGTFIGVAGMDISYDLLEQQINSLDIYRSGYAFLTDEYNRIVYHPFIATGTLLTEINSEMNSSDFYLTESRDSSSLLEYTFRGVQKRAAWKTLANGLRLFVVAPASEIEESWTSLIRKIVVTGLLLLGLSATAVTMAMRRVTEPLKRLTHASELIFEGKYDVDLPYDGRDEVGTLTRSFRHLTEHLRVYISDLNSKAYKDALTNVKNKAAFDIYCEQLDAGDAREYAVLLFDCNNLKQINDLYGHQRGDIYLQTACGIICRAFAHSPVFRIGGDEFVAILQNADYQNREALVEAFHRGIEASNARAEKPGERASIAMGLAAFDSRRDQRFTDVFKRADQEMYTDKKRLKGGRRAASRR